MCAWGNKDYYGYRHGNSNNSRSRKKPYKKRNGAKYHANAKNGVACITGYYYKRRLGLVTMVAAPAKTGKLDCTNAAGQPVERWTCKFSMNEGFVTNFETGFYNPSTGVLTVPDLRVSASTKKNWMGRWSKKK